MFYHLKSAGIVQVERAFKAGGTLDAMSTSFYSGGYVYTHVLTTKRGTQYRVSDWVVKAVSGEGQKLPVTNQGFQLHPGGLEQAHVQCDNNTLE